MIGAEDEPAGGGVVPSPFGDLGKHVADGSDAAVLVGDGDRLAGLGRDRVGDRVQVGLDVSLAMQAGERGKLGIGLGEEAAEVTEPGREAGHGLGTTRPELSFQVRDERGSQVRVTIGHAGLEGVGLLCRLGWLVDDVEVEQHGVGAHDRGPVVTPALPCRRFTGPAGGGQLVEVADGELVEGAAGLDQ